FHSFLNLMDPAHARKKPVTEDHEGFEKALEEVKRSATSEEEKEYIKDIVDGYRRYQNELAQMHLEFSPRRGRLSFREFADAHPTRFVVDPCHKLFQFNMEEMRKTSLRSEEVSWQGRLAMLILGLGGPVSGLIIGYGIARGLSRSIYQLSVRVQDM